MYLAALLSATLPLFAQTAVWMGVDSITQGNWTDTYGADGFHVIQDSAAYPPYVSVTPASHAAFTWASSTSESTGPEPVTRPFLAARWR